MNHLDQTIDYLVQQVSKMQDCIRQLQHFRDGKPLLPVDGAGAGATAVAHPSPLEIPAPRTARKVPRETKPVRAGNGKLTVVAMMREVIAGWSGPFEAENLCRALINKFPGETRKIKNAVGVTLRFLEQHKEVKFVSRNGRKTVWQRVNAPSVPRVTLADIHAEIDSKRPAAPEEAYQ